MSQRQRLSVVMIAKNEAELLPEALASVSWADEIVVLDSGSHDATADVARALGAKVYQANGWDGFGKQRQRAQAYASGEMILMLDAASRVQCALRRATDTVPAHPVRNMVYTLEMQINAWWASRESHLLLLNAPTIRRTQVLTENLFRTLSDMLTSGITDQLANTTAELEEVDRELKLLLAKAEHANAEAAQVYGYVWLSLELHGQLLRMNELIRMVLRK